MNPAVHMDGITKRFPGVVANDDVDLAVERGSVSTPCSARTGPARPR